MSCEEGAVCSPKLGYLQNLQQQSCLPQRWGIFHMLAPSTSATCPAAKRGNMEPRGNDLLKEFFPARKRIKSLPPVINQITKKALGQVQGKKKASSAAFLYPPCDSQ